MPFIFSKKPSGSGKRFLFQLKVYRRLSSSPDEYPLASCTDVSPALGALPAQLGARNLVVSLPAGEAADPAALADLAARMKEQGCAYVVVRDSERGSFY